MFTKLDMYDYELICFEDGSIFSLQIILEDRNDPIAIDIVSELSQSDGMAYVEGKRFKVINSTIISEWQYTTGKYKHSLVLETEEERFANV